MKLFRNAEVRQAVLLNVLLLLAASIISFWMNPQFGIFTVVVSLLFMVLHLFSTFKRYQKLEKLAAEIDSILHGSNPDFSISECDEGELSILKNEVQKMTFCLREQKQRLQNDKIYLADSIADISHQIRTPLTSINLLVQLLREPEISEKRKNELLRELQEMLVRIDWLITTLLKISKLDAGTVSFQKESCPLLDLMRKAAEPLQIPMELREQKLMIQAHGNFNGDISWTCEALGNIIKNCMEHTPNQGEIKINAVENVLYTEITIEDNGCGISSKDLPHIFERFYKGENSQDKSFGIGLALARMIVISQNGTLKAENQKNGALFTMRFYKGII